MIAGMFQLKHSHQAVLALLLALLLSGAQVVKDSPWHDHAQHSVDCALCHLQSFDADVPPAPPVVAAPLRARPVLAFVAALEIAASPSPYRGRAPPALS